MRQWITDSFKPACLAVPPDVIDNQGVQLAIEYWNTHSGYKITRMYSIGANPSGLLATQVQLDPEIKTVVKCYPSAMTEELFSDHPMWVLLGFITLDRYTLDLMLLSQTFEGYRIYLGDDFRWKWMRSDDSTQGGWLYLQQVPRGAAKVAVIGTKRIVANEDIKDEFVYVWVRNYARSLVKALEGNILRHAQIIGIQNAGQAMIDEALKEQEDLRDQLRKESRWLLMPVRK